MRSHRKKQAALPSITRGKLVDANGKSLGEPWQVEDTRKLKPGDSFTLTIPPLPVNTDAGQPRQKEAREPFAMWKVTANDDGTIPGTFIGKLAEEVRACVKEHPNLDSGMKLPKLLPRFITSRW